MKKLFVLILSSLLLLTSCSGVEPEHSGISGTESSDALSSDIESSVTENFDTQADLEISPDIRTQTATMSSDGIAVYKYNFAINTKQHTVANVCTKPDCQHNSDDCYASVLESSGGHIYIPYNGGFIFTQKYEGDPDASDDNYHCLMYMKDGKTDELFRNTYTNDFEKENYEDRGSFTLGFCVDDGIFCQGCNYIFKVSYSGELLVKPIEAPEGTTMGSYHTTGDKNILLAQTSQGDIVKIDLSAGTAEKCPELKYTLYYNDRLYGTDGKKLISTDMSGGDLKEIAEIDSYRIILIESDNSIAYVPEDDSSKLYKIDLDSKEKTLLLDLTAVDSYSAVGDVDMSDPFISFAEFIPNLNLIILQIRGKDAGSYTATVGVNGEDPVIYNTDV